MEELKEIDNIILCYCGNSDDPHNFHHIFDPIIFVDKCEDKTGELFIIDAHDFKAVKIFGKCTFPQCNADRLLHGTIIKHDYVPSEEYEKRIIRFSVPLDTLCRICKEQLGTHTSLTHAFTTLVKVKNRGEHDDVIIQGKTVDQTIIWI